MCFSGGKPSPTPRYLVLKLPGRLQILHGQQVVHEVHVRGHLQERSLRADSRKAGQELLQIFQNFRADGKQDDREVWLTVSLQSAYIPKLIKQLSWAQVVVFFCFLFLTFLLNLYFLDPKASRSLVYGKWLSAIFPSGTGDCYSSLTTHVKPTALSQEEILAPLQFRFSKPGGEQQASRGHRPSTKTMAA